MIKKLAGLVVLFGFLFTIGFAIIHFQHQNQPLTLQKELEKQVGQNQLLQRKIVSLETKIKKMRTSRTLPEQRSWLFSPIIYQEPSSFSHRLWIDAGTEDHVQQGSICVIGHQIIGFVDEVQSKKARVRLISDPNLAISMESGSIEYDGLLFTELSDVIQTLGGKVIQPQFQASLPQIRGYTAGLYNPYSHQKALIKVHFPWYLGEEAQKYLGHVFITNGFDGIFPSGFIVGIATHLEPNSTNGLEGRLQPTVDFENLSHLFVSVE